MNFPIFISMENKSCLVVGGGTVAKRKCEALLEYGAVVTVVAKALRADFSDLMQGTSMQLHERPFEPADLNGRLLVFVATEDKELNREIVSLCHEKHILVNVADIPELCDFYFPALVRRGDVVFGISTGGGSPALAGRLRSELDEVLPADLDVRAEALAMRRKNILAEGRHPSEDVQYQELVASVKLKQML